MGRLLNDLLLEALLQGPFSNFTQFGTDDWRNPGEKNPPFSLSSKGYINHQTGENGSLLSLASMHGFDVSNFFENPTRPNQKANNQISKMSNSEKAHYLWHTKALSGESARVFLEAYFSELRFIPSENYEDLIRKKLLRMLPGTDKFEPSVISPIQLINDDGEIEQEIRKIQIIKSTGSPRKRQLGSEGHLTILPALDAAHEDGSFVAVEGLEDALTLRVLYSKSRFAVSCSKSNLHHLARLANTSDQITIISDNDRHDDPKKTGQYVSAKIQKDLVARGCHCSALMPSCSGWDANNALMDDQLEKWVASLIEVPDATPEDNASFEERIPSSNFKILRRSEFKFDERCWLISGLIESRSVAVLAGPPESGKSHIAVDMACAIQSGSCWHGLEAQGGNVLYLSGEGIDINSRFNSWEKHHGIHETDVYLHDGDFIDMSDATGDVPGLVDQLQKVEGGFRLIVIDTMSKFSTVDENNAAEIGRVFRNLDLIRRRTGATVLLVHHTLKHSETDLRGSSAIRAAVDHHLMVKRKGSRIVLSCGKSRDSRPFEPLSFDLVSPTASSLNHSEAQNFGFGLAILVKANDSFYSSPSEGNESSRNYSQTSSGGRQSTKLTHNQKIFIDNFKILDQRSGSTGKVSIDELRKLMKETIDGFSTYDWRNMRNSKRLKQIFEFSENSVTKLQTSFY